MQNEKAVFLSEPIQCEPESVKLFHIDKNSKKNLIFACKIHTTMNLFGKKDDKKEEPQAPVTQPELVNVAPRPQRTAAVLNSQQLSRTQEALRLAQTKLANIEESLERLRDQQEWLRRYNEVRLELAQEKTRLYDLNRQVSSIVTDETALHRFETFEAILPTYLRTQMLGKASEQVRQDQLRHEQETKQMEEQWNVQQKVQQQTTEKRRQAEDTLRQVQDRVFQASRLEMANETLNAEISHLKEQATRTGEELDSLSASMREHNANIDVIQSQIDTLRARRQQFETHQHMLDHGEAVLLRLNRLQEIETLQQQLKMQQSEAVKRQDEENDLLRRIYVQFQDVTSEINSITEEMRRQRVAIQGQTTGKLLERAMSLKSRLQMLLSAQSLWNRISIGYTLIEENAQTLNALRLHIEHTETNLRALETEVAQISRLAHEKEYTYMLSKSQNVIQLRADLVEGVSCSVCGATHHPYHSDSMLEQSKLIGDFKTEFEQLSVEARNKQETLAQMKIELAEQSGRRQVVENNLADLRQRQTSDVREWQVFASLDPTFSECSPSTNLEARQAMLRQLIEKTTQDANEAQTDLERFNFHRDTINELSEQMQSLEQKKNELGTRLGEVNTGCQVMAGRVERLQHQIDSEEHNYSACYSELEHLITLPDWLSDWKLSPEGVKGRIQLLVKQWRDVNSQLEERQQALSEEQEALRLEDQLHTRARQTQEMITSRLDTCQSHIGENMKAHEQAVGESDARTLYLKTLEQWQQTVTAEQDEQQRTTLMQREMDHIQGRQDNYQQQALHIADTLAAERNELDLWIKNFNLHNPPVQYAELSDVFSLGRDWNDLRAQLSKLRFAHALSQARTDELNSRLVALQAEGGSSASDPDGLQTYIISQRQTLVERRTQLMMQMARLTATLEEHQQATAALQQPEQLMG